MTAENVVIALASAALTLVVMGMLMTIALASVYQGNHAAHDGQKDPARRRRYHRLSRDERRDWRLQESAARTARRA